MLFVLLMQISGLHHKGDLVSVFFCSSSLSARQWQSSWLYKLIEKLMLLYEFTALFVHHDHTQELV
jgi:hypothetical protein